MQINFAEFLHVDATIKTTKRQIELPSQIALPNDQTFSKSKSDLFKKNTTENAFQIYDRDKSALLKSIQYKRFI